MLRRHVSVVIFDGVSFLESLPKLFVLLSDCLLPLSVLLLLNLGKQGNFIVSGSDLLLVPPVEVMVNNLFINLNILCPVCLLFSAEFVEIDFVAVNFILRDSSDV